MFLDKKEGRTSVKLEELVERFNQGSAIKASSDQIDQVSVLQLCRDMPCALDSLQSTATRTQPAFSEVQLANNIMHAGGWLKCLLACKCFAMPCQPVITRCEQAVGLLLSVTIIALCCRH